MSSIAECIISLIGSTTKQWKRIVALRKLHALAETPTGEQEIEFLLAENAEIRCCTIALLPSTVVSQLKFELCFDDTLNDETQRTQLHDLILNRMSYKEFLKENCCDLSQVSNFRSEWFGPKQRSFSKKEIFVLSIHLCLAAREDVAAADVWKLWRTSQPTVREHRKKLMERFEAFREDRDSFLVNCETAATKEVVEDVSPVQGTPIRHRDPSGTETIEAALSSMHIGSHRKGNESVRVDIVPRNLNRSNSGFNKSDDSHSRKEPKLESVGIPNTIRNSIEQVKRLFPPTKGRDSHEGHNAEKQQRPAPLKQVTEVYASPRSQLLSELSPNARPRGAKRVKCNGQTPAKLEKKPLSGTRSIMPVHQLKSLAGMSVAFHRNDENRADGAPVIESPPHESYQPTREEREWIFRHEIEYLGFQSAIATMTETRPGAAKLFVRRQGSPKQFSQVIVSSTMEEYDMNAMTTGWVEQAVQTCSNNLSENEKASAVLTYIAKRYPAAVDFASGQSNVSALPVLHKMEPMDPHKTVAMAKEANMTLCALRVVKRHFSDHYGIAVAASENQISASTAHAPWTRQQKD